MAKDSFGPNIMTVQEATNQIAQRRIIRVTPTVIAGTTENNDVAFDATEIPNAVLRPGGCSELVGIYALDQDNEAHDMDLVFMENQTNLGTAGSAVTITDDNIQAANIIGCLRLDWSDRVVGLVNTSLTSFGAHYSDAGATPSPYMLLQAAENSTSVYFSAVMREEAAWAATDDLDFIFHIRY